MNIALSLIGLGFDPEKDFIVQDDGEGQFIKEWNTDKSKPTDEELAFGWQVVEQERLYNEKKKECGEVILSRYSLAKQSNLQNASISILGAMLAGHRSPTEEEAKSLSEAKEAKAFIDEVLQELGTKGAAANFSRFK